MTMPPRNPNDPLNIRKDIQNELEHEKRQKIFEDQLAQRRSNELMRQGKREERTSKEREAWGAYLDLSLKLLEGQKGYDNWVTAMHELCFVAIKRLDAINASDPLGAISHNVVEKIYKLGNALHASRQGSDIDVSDVGPLPSLENYVQFTADDKLDRANINLVRSDMKPVTQNQRLLFDAGINAWLATHHYCETDEGIFKKFEVDENNQPVRDDDNNLVLVDPEEQLTKAKFEDLRDGRNGLQDFLSGRFDLECVEIPYSSPRP
jgi:hypothetical protein